MNLNVKQRDALSSFFLDIAKGLALASFGVPILLNTYEAILFFKSIACSYLALVIGLQLLGEDAYGRKRTRIF